MSVKIRFARGGAKKSPYYRLVVANVTAPRDGKFIEKIGTYNPLLSSDNKERVTLKVERVEYWLSQGAQPTDRAAKFIIAAGIALPANLQKKVDIKTKSFTLKPSKKSLKTA